MNAERLLSFIKDVLTVERASSVQTRLTELQASLANLANQPQQAPLQTEVAQRLGALSQALASCDSKLSPSDKERLTELGAGTFFSPRLADEISELAAKNAMTPQVVATEVNGRAGRRQEFLTNLESTDRGLRALNFKEIKPEPGEAEIAFLLPRENFQNQLGGLIKELRAINFIIREFSEAATGKAEPIEVRQISSTDPQFFFSVDPSTILMLSAAVKWGLDAIEKMMNIKKLYHDGQKHGLSSQILEGIQAQITKSFDDAVLKHARELAAHERDENRRHELENGLESALRALVSRIEHGMTVQPLFVPPPDKKDEEPPSDAELAAKNAFDGLKAIAPTLSFPKHMEEPILQIPPPPKQEDDEIVNR